MTDKIKEKPKNANIESEAPRDVLSKYIKRKPLKYGKKFYLSEFLAEKIIQIIAFSSITVILAIFYYVFQESIYAFKEVAKHKVENVSVSEDDENLKPESYGSEEPAQEIYKSDALKPETYDADELKPQTYGADNELKPETYGAETTEELVQERYGDAPSDSPSKAAADDEVSVEEIGEKPVKVKDLVRPNSYVDNEPAYVWQPVGEEPKFSLIPLALGALKVTLIGLMIAAPIAILAALFTVAFSPKWLKEIIKPAIEILAGFPSIVIGFFTLMTLATILQEFFGYTFRLNSFVGGVGMALAVIPIIYTVAEDALSTTPKSLKEASLALGASRWQTAYRVTLPAATPGVFAAIILGFGRAFGETMIALMATGNAAIVNWDLFQSVRTMAATIGAEMAEVEFRGVHYGVLFLIGAILFVVTFSLNATAEFWVRKKLLKKFQGK